MVLCEYNYFIDFVLGCEVHFLTNKKDELFMWAKCNVLSWTTAARQTFPIGYYINS